jgi:16S rRNA (guanine966-N2)-methyltransferase
MTDRMRESLFSSIASWLPEAEILDLYAGSGSLGLEALSRGAAAATFVETDRQALSALRANLVTVGLGGDVAGIDVDRFIDSSSGRYDLVFVDPPYDLPLASVIETITKLSPLVRDGGLVVVHRRRGEEWPAAIGELVLVDERRFGGADLRRYEKERAW